MVNAYVVAVEIICCLSMYEEFRENLTINWMWVCGWRIGCPFQLVTRESKLSPMSPSLVLTLNITNNLAEKDRDRPPANEWRRREGPLTPRVQLESYVTVTSLMLNITYSLVEKDGDKPPTNIGCRQTRPYIEYYIQFSEKRWRQTPSQQGAPTALSMQQSSVQLPACQRHWTISHYCFTK